jgi:hypothetical protein
MGGKKSSGKTYVSKKERQNVSQKTLNSIRRERLDAEGVINRQRAWVNGKNPWVTIENPNKEQTNKKFIRVRMNDLMHGPAKEVRKNGYTIQGG